MGKSTIVKLVVLQLLKTNDYHILPVMCPRDIVEYCNSNIKQIYIIDDICGKFSVDQSMIESWDRVSHIASNGYLKNLTPGLLSEAAYILQRRGNIGYALRVLSSNSFIVSSSI
jgi:hypothetical protein